jgi:hypothetical protein
MVARLRRAAAAVGATAPLPASGPAEHPVPRPRLLQELLAPWLPAMRPRPPAQPALLMAFVLLLVLSMLALCWLAWAACRLGAWARGGSRPSKGQPRPQGPQQAGPAAAVKLLVWAAAAAAAAVPALLGAWTWLAFMPAALQLRVGVLAYWAAVLAVGLAGMHAAAHGTNIPQVRGSNGRSTPPDTAVMLRPKNAAQPHRRCAHCCPPASPPAELHQLRVTRARHHLPAGCPAQGLPPTGHGAVPAAVLAGPAAAGHQPGHRLSRWDQRAAVLVAR